jgi:cbb3-type cytochrome oxidase subunit 3
MALAQMNGDPLATLRDIYLPTQPHWWPPAPGWWLLAILLCAIAYWALGRAYAYWNANRPLRAARRIIDTLIDEETHANSSDALLANQCNEVLKRVLVVALDIQPLAKASGADWLQALDVLGDCSEFSRGAGQALGEARFAAEVSINRLELLYSVKRLLKTVHYRNSKQKLLVARATSEQQVAA